MILRGHKENIMEIYDLELAGLRIQLRAPHIITISENLKPFLRASNSQTDCVIELQSSPQLPAFSENGIWHGAEYYDASMGAQRIFHCTAPETAAFAVTELFENGNIRMEVLPDYLSYFTGSAGILNRIGMETLLQQHSGLLLHASLIKYEGRTIAFAGPSGVGKSTQAELWRTYLGAAVINGDRAALRKTESGWMAYGSPYAGTSGIYINDHGPLAAIVVLEQAKDDRLRSLRPAEAFRYLYPEVSMHHWDRDFVSRATDLCLELLDSVPVYGLACRPEESAVLLLKKGLGL